MSQHRAGGGGAAQPGVWRLPSPGKVSRPRLAWLPSLGHCFGTGGREHIPGTGQHRRLKGFPSSSFSFPLSSPAPHPPFYFSFSLQNQNTVFTSSGARAKWQALRGWTQELPGPSRPGNEDTSCQQSRAQGGCVVLHFHLSGHRVTDCSGLLGTRVQGAGCRGSRLCLSTPITELQVAKGGGEGDQRNKIGDSS